MSDAPSNNKGWKSHFFFISYRQGWSFSAEWTSRTVSSSVPALSADETELVEILQGILSMFNLGKMKSGSGAGSSLATPSVANAPAVGDAVVTMVEKHSSFDAEAGLRKRLRKMVAEQPADTFGSTARTSADKGKGTVELKEIPSRGALHPTVAKQVYECSSKELMNRADKSVGLHFVSAHINRVHDTGRLVRIRHEKIMALRAANKELKASVSQEWYAYKASRGFESSLEKMGRVNYEFAYRVVLEQLRGKHPDIMIELDPFTDCLEDANVEMDLDQPFDDDTPLEKQPTS
ncbi:hypothetical protein B296_00003040 [Ensete ventricosum]|uniref:Uncharacterized protein n=1 Tax=Ensete ventricosum TaxID=4639 RepID=A0A427A7N0_ENSVE|nr:hypothetical protein B296_00003040 [Ensete ventricosum]